jgi:carbon-monoxide dehydrogenase small subunit
VVKIRFKLDGAFVEVEAKPYQTLFNVLKDHLGTQSVHFGCGQGACGACMVLVNGKPRYSCLTLAGYVDGKEVVTLAGLAQDGELTPIQRAFIENNAAQCGYCMPGMILTAKALLDKSSKPSDEEIFDALSGNLCRCTGYVPIVRAIKSLVR